MSWTPPAGLRPDQVYEASTVLDGTGSFVSPWFETTGISCVRIAAFFLSAANAEIWVMDGQNTGGDNPEVIRTQSLPAANGYVYGELALTARYFRFQLGSGAGAGDTCVITIRKV